LPPDVDGTRLIEPIKPDFDTDELDEAVKKRLEELEALCFGFLPKGYSRTGFDGPPNGS
jgi:hypothetical protein